MPYYNVCPKCHANLDPGEHCTCEEQEEEKKDFFRSNLKIEPGAGQLAFAFDSGKGGCERKNIS